MMDKMQKQALNQLLFYIVVIIFVIVAMTILIDAISAAVQQVNGYDDGIAFVGDINNTKAGDFVLNAINGKKWDWSMQPINVSGVILVGDVCYKGDCSQLVKYQKVFGDKLRCIVGNHDLKKYVQDLCSKNWSFEKYDTLFIGLNTQKIPEQFAYAQRAIWNTSATNFVIVTHEPCIDSHNNKVPKGLYKLCADLRSLELPMDFISGHHHVMAHAVKYGQDYFTVGSGGGFLQQCTKKEVFDFCLSQFGYLLIGEKQFVFGGLEDDSLYVVYRK